jgi:hypothetical protein
MLGCRIVYTHNLIHILTFSYVGTFRDFVLMRVVLGIVVRASYSPLYTFLVRTLAICVIGLYTDRVL